MRKRHAQAHDWLASMQFACFDCRKSFKQYRWVSQLDTSRPKCPQCAQTLWKMGIAFKAPKQSDLKQWRKVELLIRNGYEFCSDLGRSPKTLRQAEILVKQLRRNAAIEFSDRNRR